LIAASITQTNSSTAKFSIDFIVSATIMQKNEMKIREEKFLLLFFSFFCSENFFGKKITRESERKFEFETSKGKEKLCGN
jgi:hypothetical protein